MLLIMAGGTLSATGSFKGSVTVPQGLNFIVGDVLGPTGFLSNPSEAFNTEVHVNRFYMDFYDSGEVRRFCTCQRYNRKINKDKLLCLAHGYSAFSCCCDDK